MEEVKFLQYEQSTNIGKPKGMSDASFSRLSSDKTYGSLVNKLHLIKLAGNFPASDLNISKDSRFQPKTFIDLCKMSGHGAHEYDAEDFLYVKKLDFPVNRLITLRRFPKPVTDNIYDKFNQAEPDIARMVTFFDQDTNKLDELLSFNYGMKWKELTSEMEQASAVGDQSGFTGFSKKVMSFVDPVLAKNTLMGENKLNYDPKHDQNKVYGPVDSITSTNIRDVGFDYNQEFDLVFEYELRSYGGRTPEFAMKDVIANILATTYNNGKFWPGSRYWVGERPSQFVDKMQFMNPDSIDEFLSGAYTNLKSAIGAFATKGSAIAQLKNAMSNGLAIALGKILDNVGRPSILVMNSLLSGEPTGYWHLTIGNPDNPIMCIGNLLCTNVEFKFPTDSLSYGDFPTKLQVNVKLKPGQPKDKAGIETMFNMGKQRIYHNPKSVKIEKNNNNISRKARRFYGFDDINSIKETINQVFDFVAENTVEVVSDVSDSVTNSNNTNTETTSTNNSVAAESNATGLVSKKPQYRMSSSGKIVQVPSDSSPGTPLNADGTPYTP